MLDFFFFYSTDPKRKLYLHCHLTHPIACDNAWQTGESMERQTRNTKQRTVILKKLREVTSHPTADEIHAMTRTSLPHISLGTIYRNLERLARQGDILCLENCGAQKRFDGITAPHYHVRCNACGKLGDVYAPVAAPTIEGVAVKGFTLTGVSIMFEGLCDDCAM